MTASTLETPQPKRSPRDLLARLRQNPVVLKELRGRMRGRRAFVLLTAYLVVISLLLALVYAAYASSTSPVGSANERQAFGKAIFGLVVGLELLFISFIAPALTSGAISSERENQTYDLLRTTLLPARDLVLGKFFSGLAFLFLLLFAALPLQSLAFLYGGVDPVEVTLATLILVVTSLLFCAAGIFFSSGTGRTLVSTVLAYAFAILMIFGLPLLMGLLLFLINAVTSSFYAGPFNPQMSWPGQAFVIYGGLLLISLNPPATILMTEVILEEEQSALFFRFPGLSGNYQFPMVSPWLLLVLLYLLLTVIFLRLAIRNVHRPEK